MKKEEIQSRLRGFVDDNFLYMRPDFELGADDSLMGNGIVDSMGVMEMIYFLEEEFGVAVGDEDITEENLGTLNAITNYVVANGGGAESQVA
ncbi:MAG TPA: acyl carrier protein [Longimicrobiales bacterium]|nr:acyl carrier protein [Longimicrobiales bacterium]